MMATEAQGRTQARYSFAVSQQRAPEERSDAPTRTCPRCGQRLFADMEVCYGCLYDFSRDKGAGPIELPALPEPPDPQPAEALADPLAFVALDEPDDEAASRHSPAAFASPSIPDTVDMDALATTIVERGPAERPGSRPEARVGVVITSADVTVTVPVSSAGVTVGRDRDNDIVVAMRSVSRRHLRIDPCGEGAVVRDLGAKNPAMVGALPLVGERRLQVGDELSVCGVRLRVASLADVRRPGPAEPSR